MVNHKLVYKLDTDSIIKITYEDKNELFSNPVSHVYLGNLIFYKKVPSKGIYSFINLCTSGNYEEKSDIRIIIKFNTASESTKNEIDILRQLENEPFIIHLINFYSTKHISLLDKINNKFVVEEYCEGGDLFEFIKDKEVISTTSIKLIIYQLIIAVRECHKHNIIHTDIKLENIGFFKKDDIHTLRLIDFGGSKKVDLSSSDTCHLFWDSFSFSISYMPPEMYKEVNTLSFNKLIFIDFWEIGVVLYALIYHRMPFRGKTTQSIYNNIIDSKKRNIFPKIADDNLYNFLRKLLEIDINDRLDLDHMIIDFSEKNLFSETFDEIKNEFY